MRLPLDFFNELRQNLRISDIVRRKVNLTRKGQEYSGLCPFHSEKTPSFTVNDEKKFYHCFGCSAHGDAIKFVAETQGVSYKEAAIRLANEHGIELPKFSAAAENEQKEVDYLHEILNIAKNFFKQNLTSSITDYLIARGLNEQTINDFDIGYAPNHQSFAQFMAKQAIESNYLIKAGLYGKGSNGDPYPLFNKRIMFPIKNIYNKIVGFGGRAIGDIMPKYINSPETIIFKKLETLYGEHIATSQAYKDNYAILVEGYMDVIALHQGGFKQATASLGTSVTRQHLQKLWRSADEIIVCLDGDAAGIRASNRLIELALPQISAKKSISFLKLPRDNDPDDIIKNYGSAIFQQLIKKRSSLSEFIWQKEYRQGEFSTAEAKAHFADKLKNYSNLIKDYTLKSSFQAHFKNMTWQYVTRNRNSKKNLTSQNTLTTINDSEIDYLEKTICAFLLQYPDLLADCKEQIQLQNKELSDFIDWLENLCDSESALNCELIALKVKNTSFSTIFKLLSNFDNLPPNYSFLKKQDINKTQILTLLGKKHYLLILQDEYNKIPSEITNLAGQERVKSYIAEIQRVTIELALLNEKFLLGN